MWQLVQPLPACTESANLADSETFGSRQQITASTGVSISHTEYGAQQSDMINATENVNIHHRPNLESFLILDAQLDDLKGHIDQQVRSALLDVDATSKLVEVSRSNVELATRALSDETDRVNAGVDDNLPLVTAQATLASAQSNLVESLYQYNLSKLALARASGVLEQQYRVYLGR